MNYKRMKKLRIITIHKHVHDLLKRIALYSVFLNIILVASVVWGGKIAYTQYRVIKETEASLCLQRDVALSEVRQEHNMTDKAMLYIHHINPALPLTKVSDLAIMNNKVAKALHVSPMIGLALMTQESHMDCSAISYNNTSYGCMQINLTAHKKEYRINKRKLLDMNYNLAAGYILFKSLKEKWGSDEKAFEHYYGASSDVENKKYAQSVIRHYQEINKIIKEV